MRVTATVFLIGALSAAPRDARAFTVASAFTTGCHEEITEAALRDVRSATSSARTIAPTDDERALVDDLPFSVPDDMRDLAAASLLVGVRDNDLKGRSPRELDELAMVTADPTTQQEHCLRAADDDEPNGSVSAIARCKSFIHDRAMLAIGALDATGVPDPSARVGIDVWLSLRGRVTASLPAFWVRIGQAMHALEDAFAHTYRTPDGSKVTTVLNWIDWANGTLVESRDGPPHKMTMDRCDDSDEGDAAIIARNRALAVQAATDLLSAALDTTEDAAAKSDAIDAILAKYIDYEPGCTAQNRWCDAPEEAYAPGYACSTARASRHGARGFTTCAALVAAALLLRRRRRALAASAAFVGAFVPAIARAQVVESEPRVFVDAAIGGSVADPALAQTVGARVRLGRHFLLGADVEIGEWFGLDGGRFDVGAASAYATGILRFPMRCDSVALRTTFQLGTSYELLSLYGVPSGSVGLFAGLYPLGLEWRLGPHANFFVDPLGVAVPAPRLTGTPFVYPQFRTQLGIEIGL